MLTISRALADSLLQRGHDLFPAGVALGLATIGEGEPADLLGPEGARMERMVPKRRAEFLAGRLALRRAQAAHGLNGFAVPNGDDRAPQWPDGFCGSISHSGGIAMAAIGFCELGLSSIGLDLEEEATLGDGLDEFVLRRAERAALAGCDDAQRRARVVFSIKESIYKAQYRLSAAVLDFMAVEVAIGTEDGTFEARFTRDVPPFPTGERLQGRYSTGNGFIIAGLSLYTPRRG